MTAFVLSLLAVAIATQSDSSEPLHAEAVASRGPHFVGGAIGITIRVSSGEGRPAIVPPRVRGAALREVGTDVQPISTSAIGNVVHEFNRYIYRYELTVEGAGTFTLPPFRVRLGSRSTSTPPLRLTIRPIPSNRPKTFLGGVGPISVEAEAVPASITLGERIEYRVTVTGPGSRGIRQPPTLERITRLPIEPTVTLLSDDRVESPPKRLFRYELRPTKGGDATLPPLALSTFDPRTEQFPVALSRSVPIRVVAPGPRQVERELPVEPLTTSGASRKTFWIGAASGTVAGAVLVAVLWDVRRRRSGRFHPGRWARERSIQLGTFQPTVDVPRQITESLAEFFHLTNARPLGALTPQEARAGIADAGGSTELAEEAAGLVEECDARRFDGDRPGDEGEVLRDQASRFFGELGRELASLRKHRERHSRPPQ